MRTATMFKSLVCSLLVMTFAYSQRMERPNSGPWNGRIIQKLKLTDTQKKDFTNLNTDFAKQRVEQQSKIKIATIDLQSLLKADTPDKSAIEKKINEIGGLQAQNRLLRVDHWFAVNKILNPDQQKVWKSMLERPMRGQSSKRMGRMWNRMSGQTRGPMMGRMRNKDAGGSQQPTMQQDNPKQ